MIKHAAILVAALSVVQAVENQCQEDYSPCSCTEQAPYRSVTCNGVTAGEIKQVFSRTTHPVIHSVHLVMGPGECTLPEDLLSGKVVQVFAIRGSGRDSFRLSVDIGALSPSKEATRHLEISDCDLAGLNFGFLTGFGKLEGITLQSVKNVRSLHDLPYLSSLTDLYVTHSSGFRDMYPFPSASVPHLATLELPYCQDIDDDVLAAIVFALSTSPAQQSIRRLNFDGNHVLSRIPTRVSHFTNLESISFNINSVQFLEGRTVAPISTSGVSVVTLKSNNLTYIQPGAFAGDFANSRIHLEGNNLRFFTADVFQSLLEQMVLAEGSGYVFVDSNPLSCDCSIAWLIAHHRHLLDRVNGAKCDVSGASFQDLDPYVYMNC